MTTRVLLVEDSPIARSILKRLLNHPPEVEVVGVATTGLEALRLMSNVDPDVICTDLHMPHMNGLELTQEIMARSPRPILVISASVQAEDTQTVFRLLEAGAVDVFPKPRIEGPEEYAQIQQQLLHRVQVLSGVKVFTRKRRSTVEAAAPTASEPLPVVVPPVSVSVSLVGTAPRVVAIGSSTGGPQALKTILQTLPAQLPVPVLCVQHISPGFLDGLVDWLQPDCSLPIRIAQRGEMPQPGTVYFPPETFHLEITNQGQLRYGASPRVDGHRPSVTVLFNSVAQYYRSSALGILLTGMGRDGASGLQAIRQAGGQTIAQDEASCVVFGMPQAAIALDAAQHILPLSAIASTLAQQFQTQL